jgi:hypothetical protein
VLLIYPVGKSNATYTLVDTVKIIESMAFYGAKKLISVTMPEGLHTIKDSAFYDCEYIVSYKLPSTLVNIGEYAFAYCRSMYSIDVSIATDVGNGAVFACSSLNTIKLTARDGDFLGRLFGAEKPEYNADFVPQSLRCVEIAEGSKTIPDRMFSSCKYITEVILPESLESIGIRAFYACRSLGKKIIKSVFIF